MVPLADTDQPSATEVPFLAVLDPAGSVSSESSPGALGADGAGRTQRHAGRRQRGQLDLTRRRGPAAPPINATGLEPLPWAGGQARAAEVTATCRVTVAEADPGAAGWVSCAAPAMTPSAARTTPAGTR